MKKLSHLSFRGRQHAIIKIFPRTCLGLLDILSNLRHEEDNDLFVQIEVFEEQRLQDDDELITDDGLDLNNHIEVFHALFQEVAERPCATNLLSILQILLLMDHESPVSDMVWSTLETVAKKAVLVIREKEMKEVERVAQHKIKGIEKQIGELYRKDQQSQTDAAKILPPKVLVDKPIQETKQKIIEKSDVGIQVDIIENVPKKQQAPSPLTGGPPPPPPPPPPPLPGMGGIPLPGLCGPPPPPPPPPGMGGPPPPPPPPPPLPGMGGPPPPPPPPPPLPGMGGPPPPPPPPPPPGMGGPPPPPPPPPPPGMGGPPPPPPPPGMGGPPPPPPPPGMGGPRPPPPPGMRTPTSRPAANLHSLTVSPAVPPKQKMRKFQWNKIPGNVLIRSNSCIWKKVLAMDGIQPDYETEEVLFSQKAAAVPKKEETKRKEKTEITLLDQKRSMNLNIFLKQFKKPADEIVEMIRTANSKDFDVDRLKCIKKLLPDNNEVETFKNFDGDKTKLGSAEKFLMCMLSVKSYPIRIDGMILKEDFTTAKESLEPNIEVVKNATADILHNDVLPELLNLILKVGNFLNYGSFAGNAEGFKIGSLIKLTDTRANKPRMNLMHFIVQVAEDKKELLLSFPDAMPHLTTACKYTVDQLESELNMLKANVGNLDKGLQKAPADVKKHFAEFLGMAEKDLKVLDAGIEEIRKLSAEFADYLCEDPKKFKLEEVLGIFKVFCDNLKKAKQENEQFRKQEARRIERERKKAEEEAKRIAAGGSKVVGLRKPPPIQEETCIIDKLMDEIKNGFPLKKQKRTHVTEGPKPHSPLRKKESIESHISPDNGSKTAEKSPKSRRASGARDKSKLDTVRRASLLTSFLLGGSHPVTATVKEDLEEQEDSKEKSLPSVPSDETSEKIPLRDPNILETLPVVNEDETESSNTNKTESSNIDKTESSNIDKTESSNTNKTTEIKNADIECEKAPIVIGDKMYNAVTEDEGTEKSEIPESDKKLVLQIDTEDEVLSNGTQDDKDKENTISEDAGDISKREKSEDAGDICKGEKSEDAGDISKGQKSEDGAKLVKVVEKYLVKPTSVEKDMNITETKSDNSKHQNVENASDEAENVTARHHINRQESFVDIGDIDIILKAEESVNNQQDKEISRVSQNGEVIEDGDQDEVVVKKSGKGECAVS